MPFDGHAHLAPGDKQLAKLLASMTALKIDAAVVVAGRGLSPAQLARQISAQPSEDQVRGIRYDNAELLSQCKRASGKLFPFFFCNPHDEVTEYRATGGGFSGLKVGPAVHGEPLLSKRTMAYVEIAAQLKHPVYLHCLDRDGFRVTDLVSLAQIFPTTTFILGHGGVGHIDFAAVDLILPHPHILFETSGAFLAVVQYACEQLGARRVLFGTEYPLQSPRSEFAKMLDLDLNFTDLQNVIGGNIRRLLEGQRT